MKKMTDSRIDGLFAVEKIECAGCIPFSECRIINERLLNRKVNFRPESAIFFLVPYYVRDEKRNVSVYAVARDYHIYFRGLYERLIPKLREILPGEDFAGFADSSPVAERHGASRAGLGATGETGQLISEKYGGYVFIGEILTTAKLKTEVFEPRPCLKCGLCREKCPDARCFSYLNQQKGELDGKTKSLICETGCVWGCDVCLDCCPMNNGAKETPIEFFRVGRMPVLTSEAVENMTDEEFSERAFAWKGRKTILRNLRVLENAHNPHQIL